MEYVKQEPQTYILGRRFSPRRRRTLKKPYQVLWPGQFQQSLPLVRIRRYTSEDFKEGLPRNVLHVEEPVETFAQRRHFWIQEFQESEDVKAHRKSSKLKQQKITGDKKRSTSGNRNTKMRWDLLPVTWLYTKNNTTEKAYHRSATRAAFWCSRHWEPVEMVDRGPEQAIEKSRTNKHKWTIANTELH